MPNWCHNILTLVGPKRVLLEIAATNLCLDKIAPCPDDLRGITENVSKENEWKIPVLMKKYGVATELDWHVTRWGTQWDIGPINLEISESGDDCEIATGFDSAWHPPVEAMQALFDRYKNDGLYLHLEYLEPGVSFVGLLLGEKGEIKNDHREYRTSKELEVIAKDLSLTITEGEIDWLREREAQQEAVVVKLPEPRAKKIAKPKTVTKKAAPKKPEPKAPVKQAATKSRKSKADRELEAFLASSPKPKKPASKKPASKKAAAKRG